MSYFLSFSNLHIQISRPGKDGIFCPVVCDPYHVWFQTSFEAFD